MIPSPDQCRKLWDEFNVNEKRRIHMEAVCGLAVGMAKRLEARSSGFGVNIPLLRAAAFLHDADKSISWLPGERHPEAMVRILKGRGMEEVAEVVRTHSLPAILEDATKPKTVEQKLLFLADKMAKYEVIGVEARYARWRAEDIPAEDDVLDATYPKVKAFEVEISALAGVDLAVISNLIDIAKTGMI